MQTKKNLKEVHKASKKRNRKPAVLLAVLGVSIIASLFYLLPLLFTKNTAPGIIRIPQNATTLQVADSVAKAFGTAYAAQVRKAAQILGADFAKRHGAYLIPDATSPAKAARILSSGAQHPVKITINGFRTLPALAEKISAKADFTPPEFIKAASDPHMLADHGLTPGQEMALFMDDTYEIYWSFSPEKVISKIAANFDKVWNNPQRRNQAEKLGLSPAEIATVASITDEETNKSDEKGKIARLYINRLNIGMPLQADPTVKYAVGDFTIKRILKKHLLTESPFNTYLHKGLPPGPIRTVPLATIDAVLSSKPSSDLYMCAKEDFSGRHNFASTLQQHNRNARLYRLELDRRGIK